MLLIIRTHLILLTYHKVYNFEYFYIILAYNTNIYGISLWAKAKATATTGNSAVLFHLTTLELFY